MERITIAFVLLFISLSLADLMLDPEQEGNTRVRSPHINYNALHQRGCTSENSHERACESACSCKTVFNPTWYPDDVQPQVRTAFNFAKCIWSCVLKDLLPVSRNEDLIRISISSFQSASLTIATGGLPRFTNINNSQYGICGAEGVRGSMECNNQVPDDLSVKINTDQSIYARFYFGLDCNPAPNQIDFVTVALHEIGRGLGFAGLIINNNIAYQSGTRILATIDNYYTVGIGGTKPWTRAPPNPVSTALSAIVSDNLYFEGILFNNGKIHAPSTFQDGSSIYNWDEATYPAGNINSLMTPVIGFGEAIHAVGPLTCDYLTRWGYPISNITDRCGADVLVVPSRTPFPSLGASQSATLVASQTATPTLPAASQSSTPTRPAASQSVTSTRPASSQSATPISSQSGTPTRPALSQSSTPVSSQSATPTRPASSSSTSAASQSATATRPAASQTATATGPVLQSSTATRPASQSATLTLPAASQSATSTAPATTQSGTLTRPASQSGTPTGPALSQFGTPTRLVSQSGTPIVIVSQTPTSVVQSQTRTRTPTATATLVRNASSSVTPTRSSATRSASRSVPNGSNVDRSVSRQASRLSSENFSSSPSSSLVASITVLLFFVCVATLL